MGKFGARSVLFTVVLLLLDLASVPLQHQAEARKGKGGSFGRTGGLGSVFGKRGGGSSVYPSSNRNKGGLMSRLTGGGAAHRNRGITGAALGGGGGGWRNRAAVGGRKSGFGGFGRGGGSGTLKNMIVGAAAGYLAYKGGKYLIKNLAAPMMFRNRPYYWGQSYYQPRPGYTTMCRMPIDASDPTFGNVYTSDSYSSRPKELVWSCAPTEQCCGDDCCPVGGGYVGAGGYANGGAAAVYPHHGGGGGGYYRGSSSSSSESYEHY